MGRRATVSAEAVSMLAIVALAAGLRLGDLGSRPLDASEASLALQAISSTPYRSPHWDPGRAVPVDPGYAAATSLIFSALGGSEAAARVVPAIAGTLVVMLPLLLRARWGRGRALLASLILAISPSMVAAGRQAGGSTVGLLGLALALAPLVDWGEGRRPSAVWLWVGLGLLFASGRPAYQGLLGMGLAVLLAAAAGRAHVLRAVRERLAALPTDRWWLAPAVTVGVSTALGFGASSLPGLFSSLGEWLKAWTLAATFPWGAAAYVLVGYEPVAFLFGVAGFSSSVAGSGGNWKRIAGWALAGGFLAMALFPGRQPADLIWLIFPSAFLAANALVGLAERIGPIFREPSSWPALLSLVGVLLVLSAFAGVQFMAFAHGQGPEFASLTAPASLGLGLGAVAMAVVVVFLFGAGWSLALAADGAALAAVAVALAFGISNLWHLNFTQSGFQAGDAWRPQAATPGLTLLAETLSSQSLAYSGRRDSLPIAFTSPASSQVAWRLREFPSSSSFSPEQVQQPPVVLALEGSTPPLASEYMGQSITVAERWNWLGVLPTDPVTWMVLRQTPTFPERWLLLMRTDIATLGQTDREPAP